jgi:hypothetical protein
VGHGAASVDEHAHFPADLVGDLGELAGEFLGDEAARWKPAPVQALQGSDLAGLQTLRVAGDLDTGSPRAKT